MSNKVYRIGEAAKLLGVKTSVLRFWEEEFSQIRPKRTDKGQRYYSEKDMETLTRIRGLLYDEGMTISGTQKVLRKPQEVGANTASNAENINVVTSENFRTKTHTNNTGITPEFYPHSGQVDNMPTPKILPSGFPDCDNCEENSYLASLTASMQETMKTTVQATVQSKIQESLEVQAQYKNNMLEIKAELKTLLALLSYAPKNNPDTHNDKNANANAEVNANAHNFKE